MTDLTGIIQLVQTGGFVGLLIILAFPSLRAKFGFNGTEKNNTDMLVEAMKKVFEDEDSPILVKSKIPRICDAIKILQEDVAIIKKIITKV